MQPLLPEWIRGYGIQYVAFRVLIRRRIRALIAADGAAPAAMPAR